MPFSLNRVDAMIETCKRHLTDTNSYGTPIESYLTQQLLVVFSAEIEQEIEAVIAQKATSQCNEAFATFVISSLDQVFRSTKTGDIAGLLGSFGSVYKKRFQEMIDPRIESAYNNLIVNRHRVAHESGSNLTFAEAVSSFRTGLSVLDWLNEAFEHGNIQTKGTETTLKNAKADPLSPVSTPPY